MRHLTPRRLCAGLVVAALAGAAVPAFAQTVGELTVIGHYRDRADISQAVSYADLDLTRKADVMELRHRVAFTARDLCRQLGESDVGDSIAPSCQTAAVRDAMKQVRSAVALAGTGPAYAYLDEPYVLGGHDMTIDTAQAAPAYSGDAAATAPDVTVTTTTVTNGPVADTPENRARLGGPMSNAGRHTSAAGN